MNEELLTLLRGADLSEEQIAEAKTLLIAEAEARSVASAELVAATARAADLEEEVTTANADATELRSLVQDAIDSANEARATATELSVQFTAEVERRGKFEDSVELSGARATGTGADGEDAVLLSDERLAAMETDNNTIKSAWNEIMRNYSAEYGEFTPRFAPEMGRAPSHVAGLQAVRLPGESPRFVVETRSHQLI